MVRTLVKAIIYYNIYPVTGHGFGLLEGSPVVIKVSLWNHFSTQSLLRASGVIDVCKNVPRNARAKDSERFTSFFFVMLYT